MAFFMRFISRIQWLDMSVLEPWPCLQRVVRGSAFECPWAWFDQSGSLGLDGRFDAVADALYRIVDTSSCFGALSSRGRLCDHRVVPYDYLDSGFGGTRSWSRSRKRRDFVR